MTRDQARKRKAELERFLNFHAPLLNNRVQSIKFLLGQLETSLKGDDLTQARYIIENLEGLQTQLRQAVQSIRETQETQ